MRFESSRGGAPLVSLSRGAWKTAWPPTAASICADTGLPADRHCFACHARRRFQICPRSHVWLSNGVLRGGPFAARARARLPMRPYQLRCADHARCRQSQDSPVGARALPWAHRGIQGFRCTVFWRRAWNGWKSSADSPLNDSRRNLRAIQAGAVAAAFPLERPWAADRDPCIPRDWSVPGRNSS